MRKGVKLGRESQVLKQSVKVEQKVNCEREKTEKQSEKIVNESVATKKNAKQKDKIEGESKKRK